MMADHSSDHSGDVPLEHLDYGFIQTCSDVKYLEKILRVLRSGEEGLYPDLVRFCEGHLEQLAPGSRALREAVPGASAAGRLSEHERGQIAGYLKAWQEETRKMETFLKDSPSFDALMESLPPVRGSNHLIPLNRNSVPRKSHPRPRDYGEWDRFDVDKECAKIDGTAVQRDPPAVSDEGHRPIKTEVDVSAASRQERLRLSNHEKAKGNEAFRAGDYEEAVAYYSRSLSIIPTAAAYNNRAQAQIKLKRWLGAVSDCQSVLRLQPANVKALLRRATAQDHMGNLQTAAEDLRTALREEPHNATAAKLLSEIEKKMRHSGKKILIQEIEGPEDDSSKETGALQSARPVQPSETPVGGEASSATPAERGNMGNAQKKPHGRGDGGPHGEPSNPHHHHHGAAPRRGKAASADKYRVAQEPGEKVANGSSKRGSAASAPGDGSPGGNDTVNLDAPCGALPPQLSRLKNEGNLLFKNGQFADALGKYSLAIQGYADAALESPDDLCVLYSNRAACYLKDGNSQDCIQDCTRALELQPFSLKPLLRRAMAYESLERYRKAYVDYKTVLQIDTGVPAAHDSVNRITRLLIEQDGSEWREKLPDIPLVPLAAQQHHRGPAPSAEVLQARAQRAAWDAERRAEVQFTAAKQEGNDLVKKGQFLEALEKYSECLRLKPEECVIYTNRALCYLKLERFPEARQDCDAALQLEPTNKKAFYRRALANKGLKDYLACSSDLQEVLQQDPNVQEAEKELEEVTALLRQSLANDSPAKQRRTVPISEVDDDADAVAAVISDSDAGVPPADLRPASAYDFGQSLNAARRGGNAAACAELLASTAPETLPQFLGSQLDGQTVGFIMQALDSHLLEKDPGLVYRHLSHLHTAERFSVVLMLLEKDERRRMTQLFEHLAAAATERGGFTRDDVQNLANKYI